jgi:hypothetical protein
MPIQKYSVNQYLIESLLSRVREGEIAIPEIQRPFVWESSQVRDLLDSLYQGFPVGYLIAWRNPDVKLKDGKTASGKMILIDGQQRITALTAAVLGQRVITKDYRKVRISIAFHPIEQRFEVYNAAIAKDSAWVPDIAPLVSGEHRLMRAVEQYLLANPHADRDRVEDSLSNLTDIAKKQIGLIELAHDLDIETVTEIFIRINSKGTSLSQADFVMSKIAADELYGGQNLRKCIDYFCHLAVAPESFDSIKENDNAFSETPYFQKLSWVRNESDDLYDPSYSDLLRVAFTSQFGRGKLSDLVSLLSGRNFETKQYEETIAEATFELLRKGVTDAINESHFKRFVMIVKSAGFIASRMIRTQSAMNFAYIVYLHLRAKGENDGAIESLVRRWFVMSLLTGRYTSSSETQFDRDIRQIAAGDVTDILDRIEKAELSSIFWDIGLVQNLETSGTSGSIFWIFIAAQIRANDKGFLSRDITVRELVSHLGDIHHIVPQGPLKVANKTRSEYNQIANFAFAQEEINIRIGKKSPAEYMTQALAQCDGAEMRIGSIDSKEELEANLAANCIPASIAVTAFEDYEAFLTSRRPLMAEKMRRYYESL